MLLYTLIAALAAAGIAVVVLLAKLWRLRQRQEALRGFLDSADALERELQACRERMQTMHRWVSTLPSNLTADALASLNLDPLVQKALRDLLQQRLWLRDHGSTAPLGRLRDAHRELERARRTLAENMERLEAVSNELLAASSESHPVSALIAGAYGIGSGAEGKQPDPPRTLH